MKKYTITHYPNENIYRVENPNGGARLSYSAYSGMTHTILDVCCGRIIPWTCPECPRS